MTPAYVKNMPLQQFLERGERRLLDFSTEVYHADQIATIFHEKSRKFGELNDFLAYCFDENVDYDKGPWFDQRKRDPVSQIGDSFSAIEGMEDLSEQKFEEVVIKLVETQGIKLGITFTGYILRHRGRICTTASHRAILTPRERSSGEHSNLQEFFAARLKAEAERSHGQAPF